MSITVCLSAGCIDYPNGGGHLWVYLNWALGLRANGCQVIWLEGLDATQPDAELQARVARLKNRLERYGLADSMALWSSSGTPLPDSVSEACLCLDAAAEADLLLNLRYNLAPEVVRRFPRSALVDIDPGELQIWMSKGAMIIPSYDIYFTTGETVGQLTARFPDGGVQWVYTPPCVALDWWPPRRTAADAPFTTVAHWYDGWMEDEWGGYGDGKRSGFEPFLELPRHTTQALELALDLVPEDEDQVLLWKQGWRVRDSLAVASTPWDYQGYIQESRGEFSCAKPHCVRLQNAWISDRTLCYLASGKPAVVQHTGPSRILPDAAGLFRFRDMSDAVRSLEIATSGYEKHSRLARALAEEFFDARKVTGRVLEQALP